MRSLLKNRKGSAAFATVVGLIPLIGMMAVGGEAGTWFVTKQRAQNAADAAAYAGAFNVACNLVPATCKDTQTYVYRSLEFASQNGFCTNNGILKDAVTYPGRACPASLPGGVTQTVTIERGNYAAGAWTTVATGTAVRATVNQTQPPVFGSVLGLTTVSINAQSIANVQVNRNPCVLSLSDPINFGGSTNVSAPGCGMVSDNTTSGAVTFTGNGNTVDAPISAQGGCTQNTGTPCSGVTTGALPTPDPLSPFNLAMASLTTSAFPNGKCTGSAPQTYASKGCYNTSLGSASLDGVYFFSGNITIGGGSTVITAAGKTATLVLLPGSSLTINGNANIQLSARATVSASDVPTALSSVTSYMSGLLIYDPETSTKTVNVSGSASSYFNGIVYIPNSDVTYTGNNSVTATCSEVIAKGVTFTGNSTLTNSGCPTSVQIASSFVRLVQ